MKTEKELDNLFKQGLEEPGNYQSYREEDWLALEAMLDKEKKRGIIFWLPLLSGAAALLILALAWFFVKPATDKNNKGQVVNITKPTPKELNTTSLTFKKPALTTAQSTAGKSNNDQAIVLKPAKSPVNNKTGNGSTGHKQDLNLAAVKNGKHIIPQNEGDVTRGRPQEMLAAVDSKVFTQDELNTAIAFNALNVNYSKPLKTDNKKAVKLSGFHPQYALTVLASSNFNGVGSFSNSEMGTAGGFLFSAGVTKKLTISIGAVYAYTPYSTEFYNYHTSYKFKTDPQTVNADCRVLDIPLNVDYKFAVKGKNAFSVGSGLSTYIMLREDYHYNYANYNPYALTDVAIVNKNRHFLGVLNLEATYQRQLNTKLSLAVQPYVKLPLTDIGGGQVKLQSTGVAVGLSWNINTLKH